MCLQAYIKVLLELITRVNIDYAYDPFLNAWMRLFFILRNIDTVIIYARSSFFHVKTQINRVLYIIKTLMLAMSKQTSLLLYKMQSI